MKRFSLLFALIALCLKVAGQPIYFADFNAGLPAGWTILNGGTTPDTWYVTGPTGFANNTLNGSAFAFVNSDAVPASPARTLSERLLSPVFNGNAYGQIFLEFDHFYRDYSIDTGFVEVFNGTSWVVLAAYSTTAGAWNAPAHATFNLTAYKNANMQVRFRYEDRGVWAWYWAVDNVNIYSPPPFDATLTALNPVSGTCGLGLAEPVAISIRNDGTSPITSLPVSFQINGGAIITETITTPIPAGGSLNYTFVTGANMGTPGVYNFKAWTAHPSDGDRSGDTISNVQRKNHRLISTFPYVEDFEQNNGGWFAVGSNLSWAWGTPNKTVIQGASSGQKAWTTGGLTGDYPNNENSFLEGPCLDLTALTGPWFGTDIWWNAEFSWDGAALQASVDGGVTWSTVGAYGDPYNWYNDETIDGNPGGQRDGWTGRTSSGNGSNGWVRAAHSLANLSGNAEVLLRLAFATDGSVVDDGIAFDRITVAAQPVLNLGPDVVACDSFEIQGGSWAQYEWSTQDTTPSIWVHQSGTYSLAIRDSFGFPAADVIVLDIDNLSAWDLGPDQFFCTATSVLLSGPGDATVFAWSTGDTNSTISISASGVYTLIASSPAGCTAMDSVSIAYSSLNADILPGTDTICRGAVVQFQAQPMPNATYWWDFGNGSFSSNANPFTVFPSGGTYWVDLTVDDGVCADSVRQLVFVDICTGLDEQENEAFTIFPNPSTGMLHLVAGGSTFTEGKWKICDAQGRVVKEGIHAMQGEMTKLELDLKELPAGIYSVGLEREGRWNWMKWVLAY